MAYCVMDPYRSIPSVISHFCDLNIFITIRYTCIIDRLVPQWYRARAPTHVYRGTKAVTRALPDSDKKKEKNV